MDLGRRATRAGAPFRETEILTARKMIFRGFDEYFAHVLKTGDGEPRDLRILRRFGKVMRTSWIANATLTKIAPTKLHYIYPPIPRIKSL